MHLTFKRPRACAWICHTYVNWERIKAAGLNFLLDIHYSDTWTDPGQHGIPARWTMENALTDSCYKYTREVLLTLLENGAKPDFIQPFQNYSPSFTPHLQASKQQDTTIPLFRRSNATT